MVSEIIIDSLTLLWAESWINNQQYQPRHAIVLQQKQK
jgi:hypothetical protein